MGHKVHPKVFRLGITTTWSSRWFSAKNFQKQLREDTLMRAFVLRALKDAQVAEVIIERKAKGIVMTIRSAKPGIIIGRAGAGIEELKKKVMKEFYRGKRVQLQINVEEIQRPALAANVVAQQIVADLEKRLPFRRSMKMAIERSMKAGALGVKIRISGRLNGAEIARTESLSQGKVPLHNFRADIDYGTDTAHTLMGTIGVKTWIYRGDVFKEQTAVTNAPRKEAAVGARS